jgi:flagellar biosynthesis protein FlhF
LRIQSFYANSIRDAIEAARRELGADAMIIASRKTEGESSSQGDYEVVCGVQQAAAPPAPPAAPLSGTRDECKPPVRSLLRDGIEALRGSLRVRVRPAEAENGSGPTAALLAAGFDEDLASDIVAGLAQRARRKGGNANLDALLPAELEARLPIEPELGRRGAPRRIVALVGPPGAGKTTTLVKLAVTHGLTGRRPLQIISTDTYRIGGTDALRTYAAAMGVPFQAVETPTALVQALAEHENKGLILIDTAGIGPRDTTSPAPLASVLSRHPEVDVQLVIPACWAAADMVRTAERFRPFLPSRLIFTGVDTAAFTGPAVALAISYEKPVSFLGTGQQIPEDIEAASAARLIGGFVKGNRRAVSAA